MRLTPVALSISAVETTEMLVAPFATLVIVVPAVPSRTETKTASTRTVPLGSTAESVRLLTSMSSMSVQ